MSDASSMHPKISDDSASSARTETSIKFAFKLQKTESTDISPKHCDILVAITKSDLCSVILDKDGNQLNISPNSKIDHKFSYEKFPQKHFQMVCVTHTIATTVPFSTLKRDIRNVLTTCRATVTVHTWKTLDVRDAGWLLQMNPRTHNRDNIVLRLRQAIQQISNKVIPEFHLYVKTISDSKPSDNNRISIPVIVIECESASLVTLRELLHSMYSSNKVDLPGKFIPMNFPHIQSASVYTQLIQQQKSYLETHRNITVTNITSDDLKRIVNHDNAKMSILSAISQFNAITWISPDNSSSDTPKLNISTTETSYFDTCAFIKNTILSNVPKSTTNPTHSASTSPINPPTISPTTKNYLAALTSNLPPPSHISPQFVSQPY